MARIEEQLAEATEVSPLTPLVGAADVAAAWHGQTLGAQRAELQALFAITVQPAGRGFRPDVRQRVTIGPPPCPLPPDRPRADNTNTTEMPAG
jgi:hypothetical protein